MSQLQGQISIGCPLAQAGSRLGEFFKERASKDGKNAQLTLRISVSVPGLPVPLTLERSVIATIESLREPAGMTPRYCVGWAPEIPGPFPVFAGELYVEAAEDYDSFALHLRGEYTPPLGLVGQGLDLGVGNRIAQATASDLLRQIKDRIEERFQQDETRKLSLVVPEPGLRDAAANG